MKCPKCYGRLEDVEVNIEGSKNKALSKQCTKCEYFEKKSSYKVLDELND